MNAKTLVTLEFNKILDRLVKYAGFSASAQLVEELRPSNDLEEARLWQAYTREARHLLNTNDAITFSGATDLRPMISLTEHDGILEPSEFLAVKNTLIISRTARLIFEQSTDEVPNLAELALGLSDGLGLVDAISKTISDRGEVLDSASDALSRIRGELRVTYERLISRLQKYLTDPSTSRMLQENLITQRSDRYVIPLRAEFKGRIKAIIHDQSASGATLFIEPLTVVEWNNRYKELQLAERDEIRRILHALSQRVAANAEAMKVMVVSMAELDKTLICAKYAEDLRANEPELLPFTPKPGSQHPGSTMQLLQARHPLLDPTSVVPIDVELDDQTYALVITGPNTGGKTVTLKTVGLLALMAQSGLQIPALSGSRLSLFRDIFADIGDEQSIEQSLSTFSGHITQLVSILKKVDPQCLVLLDELGAGTDPQEGSALAMAVMTHLLDKRITCMIATHYPELKAYAHSTPGVVNASVEFDLKSLKPTYHLTIGLPGRSNALAIAERLGLPQEIIAAARSEINPADLRAEDLLDEIHRQRDLARESRLAADKMRQEAEGLRGEIAARLDKVEDERMRILAQAREQGLHEIEKIRSELEELRRDLARARQPLQVVDEVEEVVEHLEVEVAMPVERKVRMPHEKVPSGPLRLGEKVLIKSLGQEGVVTSIAENEVEVQIGVLRVRARRGDVGRKAQNTDKVEELPAQPAKGKTSLPGVNSPGVELDIRGQRVEEALEMLDRYLERAYLAGLPYVRIIHGKGTGKLRQAIREALRQAPQVGRFESGGETEGGDGVTVAFMRSVS